MEPFTLVGKARQVFDLIALKAKAEEARLKLEAELKKEGGENHETSANRKARHQPEPDIQD